MLLKLKPLFKNKEWFFCYIISKSSTLPRVGYSSFKLSEYQTVERSFTKGGKTINIFKLHKICGTCIAKDKNKGHVTLLTTEGVVNIKFRKEYFSMFDKQISVIQPDGTKKIMEKKLSLM